jgi:hypothetical protein
MQFACGGAGFMIAWLGAYKSHYLDLINKSEMGGLLVFVWIMTRLRLIKFSLCKLPIEINSDFYLEVKIER